MRICHSTRSKPGDRLGDGMLDLEARVHLQEPGLVLPLLEDELHRAETVIADRVASATARSQQLGASARRAGSARAPPRSASDGCAGSSNRVRTDGRRCHACRPRSAPRDGAAAAAASRAAATDRRRPPRASRRARSSAAREFGSASTTRRMPLPPPPAEALIITGKPMRRASRRELRGRLIVAEIAGHARHAGRRGDRAWRRSSSPSPRCLGRRADEDHARPRRRAAAGRASPTGSRSRDGSPRRRAAAAASMMRVEPRDSFRAAARGRSGPPRPPQRHGSASRSASE